MAKTWCKLYLNLIPGIQLTAYPCCPPARPVHNSPLTPAGRLPDRYTTHRLPLLCTQLTACPCWPPVRPVHNSPLTPADRLPDRYTTHRLPLLCIGPNMTAACQIGIRFSVYVRYSVLSCTSLQRCCANRFTIPLLSSPSWTISSATCLMKSKLFLFSDTWFHFKLGRS